MELKDIIALSVGAIILLITIVYLVHNQKQKVNEWLLWAVTEAEKLLGEKTGQLKLHTVYSWFCSHFPIVAAVLPFKVFSAWVDTAVDTLKEWLKSNKYVIAYVNEQEATKKSEENNNVNLHE